MPLTQLQARDGYILGSMGQFLDRNIKQAYDSEVAATSTQTDPRQKFPTPLSILQGKPDDKSIVRKAPSIAISILNSGESDRAYGIGDVTTWRHRQILFSCFPSTDGNGAPCEKAALILRSYMQNCFEGETIRIIDYSNLLCSPTNIVFCNDVMYIVKISDPIDRSQTTALAEEMHRFDVHLQVKFAVTASLAN